MGRPTDDRWQLCRLARTTVAALREWSKGLDYARELGSLDVDPGERGWSIDGLIRILLSRDTDKRQRGRKPRKASRDARAHKDALAILDAAENGSVNTTYDPPLGTDFEQQEAD